MLVAASTVAAFVGSTVRATADEGNGLPIEVEVADVIEAGVPAVRSVLLDLEGFGRWFPATAEWRVLDRPEPGRATVYGRQALPWPVADRDYVVEYRWGDEEGVFVLSAVALGRADPAAPPSVVRIERMRTEWRVESTPGGAAVRYRYQGDVGGRLPEWVARTGWRSRTPVVIERLREEVERRAAAAGDERSVADGEDAHREDEE